MLRYLSIVLARAYGAAFSLERVDVFGDAVLHIESWGHWSCAQISEVESLEVEVHFFLPLFALFTLDSFKLPLQRSHVVKRTAQIRSDRIAALQID